VNEDEKVVTVVFRGSSNLYDWLNNMRISMEKNVTDYKPGLAEKDGIGIHQGFHRYLNRRRVNPEPAKSRFDYILKWALDCMPDDTYR